MTVNVGDYALPAGTPGTVDVTVTCVVDLADITLPGVPGTRTITATASSVLDTYRVRS